MINHNVRVEYPRVWGVMGNSVIILLQIYCRICWRSCKQERWLSHMLSRPGQKMKNSPSILHVTRVNCCQLLKNIQRRNCSNIGEDRRRGKTRSRKRSPSLSFANFTMKIYLRRRNPHSRGKWNKRSTGNTVGQTGLVYPNSHPTLT